MTNKHLSRLTPFMLLLFIVHSIVAQNSPISLHPENPHYFFYKNKPAVLITSAEHYGAVLNLDFDYVVYLDELKAKNLNMTRTFSGVYCEPPGAFNITKNTLGPVSHKYITPWARSSTPGYRNGGNKFDLTKWDDQYFIRLKDFISEANKRDVVVEFTLFCPFYEDTMWIYSPMHSGNNINSTPDISRNDVHTLDKSGALLDIQKTLVRKLITELNTFNNVIFEICNEPYFGGVTMEWQHAIADVIIETEKSLSKRHLVSQNIQNGASVITDPHPGVSVFNFHYAYPPVAVAYNYGLNKVIGDNETGFRGVSDSTYRFEGWWFIMAGGALYNNLDYSFTPDNERGDFKYPAKQPGGGSDSLRVQLKHLRQFIERFNFVKMRPDSLVIDGAGLRYSAISEEGKQYGIYMIDDTLSSLTLNVPSGKYEVVWIHPVSGKYEKNGIKRSENNKLLLRVPEHNEDIALRLVRK